MDLAATISGSGGDVLGAELLFESTLEGGDLLGGELGDVRFLLNEWVGRGMGVAVLVAWPRTVSTPPDLALRMILTSALRLDGDGCAMKAAWC